MIFRRRVALGVYGVTETSHIGSQNRRRIRLPLRWGRTDPNLRDREQDCECEQPNFVRCRVLPISCSMPSKSRTTQGGSRTLSSRFSAMLRFGRLSQHEDALRSRNICPRAHATVRFWRKSRPVHDEDHHSRRLATGK